MPRSPEIIDALATSGGEPIGNTPHEGTGFLKVDIARWNNMIRQAKVKVE